MPRYEFTAQAERDLEAIVDYTVEHWGSRQAEEYLNISDDDYLRSIDGMVQNIQEARNEPIDKAVKLDDLDW